MATADKKSQKVPNLVVPESGLPLPEAVNWFQFSRAADAVQLSVGYIDLNAIHRAATAAKAERQIPDLSVEVSHRLVMSMAGLNVLKAQLDDLLRQFAEQAAKKQKQPL